MDIGIPLSNLLSTALGVLSLAALAGYGLIRGQVASLREQLADSRAETASIRQSRDEDRAEHARDKANEEIRRTQEKAAHDIERVESETRITTLDAELTALRRIVTGEEHWRAISSLLDVHHAEAVAHWDRSEANSVALLEAVKDPNP